MNISFGWCSNNYFSGSPCTYGACNHRPTRASGQATKRPGVFAAQEHRSDQLQQAFAWSRFDLSTRRQQHNDKTNPCDQYAFRTFVLEVLYFDEAIFKTLKWSVFKGCIVVLCPCFFTKVLLMAINMLRVLWHNIYIYIHLLSWLRAEHVPKKIDLPCIHRGEGRKKPIWTVYTALISLSAHSLDGLLGDDYSCLVIKAR